MTLWMSALIMLATGSMTARAASYSFGVGGYFLQPHEVTGAASKSEAVIARPILVGRSELALPRIFGSESWVLEPHIGLLFPRSSDEGMTTLAGFGNVDVGYFVTEKFFVSVGAGLQLSTTFSSGSNVEIGGEFVTPSGAASTWVFTNDFGLGYWLDEHFRLDAGTVVERLLNPSTRKFRYFIEVAYAF